MMMVLDKVKNTIKRYNLIERNSKIVVGVSGGPDSVALLYILCSLKKELRLSLYIAHLDHSLRKDSHKDAIFVKELADNLKIPITISQVNVKELTSKGSLEEIARNVRLGFLSGVAKDIKADKIALGHNLDDQAETVLMRILRGSGLYGLAGILPKRKILGFEIIRPLIEITRKEIESFLKRKKIKCRRDITNLQDIYFRNKIRNKLLPLLERGYNRNIKKVLSNLAESASLDYDYLNQQAQTARRRLGRNINLNKFLKLHPAIRRLVIRQAIAHLKGDLSRITFKHIKEIEDLLFNRPFNSIVDLPKGISVLKKKKSFLIYRKNANL